MTPEGNGCFNVLVKLPDGNYLDGVVSGSTVLKDYPAGTQLDEMAEFDPKLLDKWSYGLDRRYKACPNYSDETTARLIDRHLAMLSAGELLPAVDRGEAEL